MQRATRRAVSSPSLTALQRPVLARRRAAARTLPAGARTLLGAAAGLAVWSAFPPLDWWPLAVVGVALLWFAVRGARARVGALVGLVAGLATFVPMLTWLRTLGIDAWLLLALSQALWFAAFGAALTVAGRLPAWPLWGACLWVTLEWARSRVPLGGFSWGRLGFAMPDAPMGAYAALGGVPVVTFAVAVAGGLLAWLLVQARRSRAVLTVAALGALAAVLTGGLAVPLPTAGERGTGPARLQVAIVQGNVPRLGLDAFAQARAVVTNHARETERLAADVRAGRRPAPDLVVWPENSTDVDPSRDAQVHELITQAVRAVGVPTMVGAVLDGPGSGHVRNASVVWDPRTGPGDSYVKQHLVPFGEYVPLRSVLASAIGRFSLVPRDFVAGTKPGVLHTGPVTVADVICFEVAYDGIVREAVNGGGRLLVVQTNDATYEHKGDNGHGGETAQQLEITRMRAIEHGRAAVIAATSGVSAVIAPDGTVRQRSAVFRPAVLDAEVPLRDSRTLADRVGATPEWVLALLGLVVVAGAAVRRRWEARP